MFGIRMYHKIKIMQNKENIRQNINLSDLMTIPNSESDNMLMA